MRRGLYHLLAAVGLSAAAFTTLWLAPRFAAEFAKLDPSTAGILTVLGWSVAALVSVSALAVVLWPVRRFAGMPTLRDELCVEAPHGLAAAVATERRRQEAMRVSNDPRQRRTFHVTMAAIGAMLSVGAVALAWGTLVDGWYIDIVIAAAIGVPLFTLVHVVSAIRAHRAAATS